MQLEVEEKSVKRSVGGVFCCNQASRKDGVLKEWDVLIRCSNNIGRLMRRVGGGGSYCNHGAREREDKSKFFLINIAKRNRVVGSKFRVGEK